MESTTSLCSICSSVSLQSYFQPNYPSSTPATRAPYEYPEPSVHDYLQEVLSRNDSCHLCRLIGHAVHSAVKQYQKLPIPDPEQSQKIDIQGLFGVPSETKLRCYIRPEPIEVLESEFHLIPNQVFRIVVTLRLEEESKDILTTPDISKIKAMIQLLDSSANTLNTAVSHLGRVVGSTMDSGLIRRWFNICAEYHAHTTPSSKKPPSPLAIHLIDIHERRIFTSGSDNGYIHYAALSYTWGGDQNYKLLRDNFDKWRSPNGLPDYNLLPKTIRDAIQLTMDLGERYLWVDALCIVQDDPPARDIQLQQMNWIYELAQFTIVAAAGVDAEAGLPGLTPNSRHVFQLVEQICGIDLSVPFPTLETTIASTKWNTRGWTYQEQLLSTTLLIFTPHQVYFQCDRKVFQEDVHIELEGRLRNITWVYPGIQLSVAMERLNTFRTLSLFIHEGSPIGISERYKNIVKVYTKRDFGNPADMLAGFTGITGTFQRAPGSMGYVGGLSVAGFEDSLLWVPCGPISRRQDPEGHQIFPSWTFLGWIGQCHIEWVSNPESPVVREWFAVHRLGSVSANSPSSGPLKSRVTWSTCDIDDAEVKTRLPLVTYNALHFREQRPTVGPFSAIGDGSWELAHSHAIEFTTFIGSFYISKSRRNFEHGFPILSRRRMSFDYAPPPPTFCILDDDDQWIGTVMINEEDAAGMPDSGYIQHDFLLISSRGAPVGRYADSGRYSIDWKKGLNVLMVQRMASGEFTRLGAGIVQKDAWDVAETREEYVRLI